MYNKTIIEILEGIQDAQPYQKISTGIFYFPYISYQLAAVVQRWSGHLCLWTNPGWADHNRAGSRQRRYARDLAAGFSMACRDQVVVGGTSISRFLNPDRSWYQSIHGREHSSLYIHQTAMVLAARFLSHHHGRWTFG